MPLRVVEAGVMFRLLAVILVVVLSAPAVLGAESVSIPGGEIAIEYSRAPGELDRARMLAWVKDSANAVVTYYGRFPVETLRLVVTPASGRGIGGGRTWAHRGALIRIRVGESSTVADYAADWVLVHEMTHLALPSLPDANEWLEEGLATYVESIARAQAGELTAEQVWAGFVNGMPNGLPQSGDRGLDHTHTWGRTYWGGALFCLLADLEIRRRTENRHGLQDALRAILDTGNMATESQLEPLLAIGDRAVGVPVLAELYGRMKDQPMPTELGALWQRLGILREGRSVRLLEDAPEAALRRAITEPPG